MPRPEVARRRFLVVYNPRSGKSRRRLLDAVCARIASSAGVTSLVIEHSFTEIRDVVRDAAASGTFDAAVAAGGDGTIRAVAAGLDGTSLPLGVIALGTGNVLAIELALPREPAGIAEMLMRGPTITLSCGRVDGEPFLLMVSAGFDAAIVRRCRSEAKRFLGKLAYAAPLIAQLSERPTPFRTLIDGVEHRATWLVVSNASHYAGRFVIAPDRTVTAPGFTALVVTTRSRRGLLGVMLEIAAGRRPSADLATLIPCRRVEIPDAAGVPIQVDGDAMPRPSLLITEEKSPLRLITHASFRAADHAG